MSVIITSSLVIKGNTFIGPNIVTDELDFYFDVGNINSFDNINNNKSTLNNIAKGGGNPYISSSFLVNTGSSTLTNPFTSSFNPNFGGCLYVSRSSVGVVDQANFPAISLQSTLTSTSASNTPLLPSDFCSRYLNGRNKLTLGIWHYRIINTGLSTQGNFFVAPSPSSTADNLFNIYATGNGLVMSANFAYGSGNFTTANSPSGIAERWNYYTCVFNNGLITVYANGVPGTPVTLGGGATTLRNTGARFFIGGSWGGPNSSRMVAYLGPIQIYGKALTQQEILQNYHSMKGRFGIYS